MQITGPEQFIKRSKEYRIQSIIDAIELEFMHSKCTSVDNSARAIIKDTSTKEDRNEVAKLYVAAGWAAVTHETSAENGERPGLVAFNFHLTLPQS